MMKQWRKLLVEDEGWDQEDKRKEYYQQQKGNQQEPKDIKIITSNY